MAFVGPANTAMTATLPDEGISWWLGCYDGFIKGEGRADTGCYFAAKLHSIPDRSTGGTAARNVGLGNSRQSDTY